MSATVISGRVELDLERGDLGSAVARRVVGAVFAQAGLGLDRLSDAAILAEALAARGPRAPDGDRVRFALQPSPGTVSIELGPLADGQVDELRTALRLPGLGSVVERLPDAVSTREEGSGTYLVMDFREPGLRVEEGG